MFACYDTQDDLWMGDDNGVVIFDNEMLARIAAQMIDVRMGWGPGRVKARPYDGCANKVRDELTYKRDALTALKGMESGRF